MRIREIIDAVASHALASGYFSAVNGHEPKSKNPAVEGITCAVWSQLVTPIGEGSGLSVSSGRLELTVRVYTNMLAEPQDDIDPNVIDAVDALLVAYQGDLTLGGESRNVDIFGTYGPGLEGKAGYIQQGPTLFRVMDIRLPIIINDLWPQAT